MAEADVREEVDTDEPTPEMVEDYINTQSRIQTLTIHRDNLNAKIAEERDSFYKRYQDSVE